MTQTKEIQLLEQKDLREKCINRVEVLHKVKNLFLIPELNVMTTKMVADYYEVALETVQSCYNYNKNEINEDGVVVKPYKEFSNVGFQQLKTFKGKAVFRISDNVTLEIPTRGVKVFPQRAILRIGMLLRDSKIAQEVRTQLLNTFEQSTDEQKTVSINEEQQLYLEVGQAYMSGDLEGYSLATKKAIDFKNRHITKLQNANVSLVKENETLHKDNKALSGEVLQWSDRSSLNRAIRVLASRVHKPFGVMFNELYEELRYKHNIGLTQRGEPPYIQYIKEDEWKLVIQTFSALCEKYNYSMNKIIENQNWKIK